MYQKELHNKPRFDDRWLDTIQNKLDEVGQIIGVSWDYDPQHDNIQVVIEGEELIFGHPRSAIAFIDGLLDGYNHGFAAGRACEREVD